MNRANRPRLSRISGSSYASKLLGRAGDGSTLTLDFTTGQLDPRLTFTRNGGGTYIGNDGLVYGMDFATSSSLAIGTGSKSVTLTATAGVDRRYLVGQTVYISNGANNMSGPVTAYNASTQVLTINATATSGSGSFTSWAVGNASPRFDHDPTTLAPRGLLIEGTATNLVTYSPCSTTGWAGLNATGTNNSDTSPENTTTATLWTGGGGGVNRAYSAGFSVTSGSTYTISAYVKKPSSNAARYAKIDVRSAVEVLIGWPTNGVLDLDTGIASGTGYTVTPMQNGWYRIVSTGTVNSTTTARMFLRITDAAGAEITSTNALLWWGAQAEAGSGASSLIPTGASTVQRLADICYIPDGDHSWFTSKNNCVLFMQCEIPRTSNFGNLMYLGQWSGGEYSYGHQVYSFAATAVSAQTKINAATSTDQGLFANQSVPINLKIAMCPNSDAARLARAWNGTASETTGLTPTASRFPAWTQQARFGIGTNAVSLGSSLACNIYVRTVKFFPFAMSNAQLQALTT